MSSEGMGRAFALGWPYLRIVGDDPLGSALPPSDVRWQWSREDALAQIVPKLAAKGLVKSERGTLGPADALAFARQANPFGPLAGWQDESDLFVLEGLVGSHVLAEATVTSLEELSENEWRRAHRGALGAFFLLGFVLLRVAAASTVDGRRHAGGDTFGEAEERGRVGARAARRGAARRTGRRAYGYEAEVHGAKAVFFSLADRVTLVQTDDGGALVLHGESSSDAEELAPILEAASAADWLPVTTLSLPSGSLVGQSASRTLADARESGEIIQATLAAGDTDVRQTREDEPQPAIVWLRRIAT